MDKTQDVGPEDQAGADLFDFDSIEDVHTGELRIKDRDGAPTPMVIILAGPEHPERKRRQMARQRRFRQEWARSGKIPVSDPTDDFDEKTEDLVADTLGWTGAKAVFSKDAARALYTDPKRQWLRVQVEKALEERERFLAGSATR